MSNTSITEKKAFFKKVSDITREYKEELLKEILMKNIIREKILSLVLMVIDILLIIIHTYTSRATGGRDFVFAHVSYLHLLLFLVPLVFLVLTYMAERTKAGIAVFRILHMCINIFALISSALISINNVMINKQPFSFIMAMFIIASIVLLDYLESAAVFLVSYGIYTIGVLAVQTNFYSIFEDLFFAGMLTVVALTVSRMNYSSYMKNFINNKIILKKNEEIDNLYREAEENLKKRTEELRETVEYEKLRTAFFANISHELRTPLNVIYSAEQMLDVIIKSGKVVERKTEIGTYMNIIKQNCFRLIRLIANLIDITKIDAGYFNVNLSNNDIVKVVEDITLSVAKYVEDRRINLVFDTEIEERIIACDPDKIERIMLNLLSNAIKFTGEGGSIYVNISESEDKLMIAVKDTGVGIPSEMRESIFEKFIQVDKTTSRTTEGSGIGLSLVKSLVELHGGTISLISAEGKGSEFIIEIPESVLLNSEESEKYNVDKETQHVEKINIEFSDIYS